jgi:biotin carboxylase
LQIISLFYKNNRYYIFLSQFIMKKVLLLGGSHFQIPSIIAAKEMGLYVLTCDYISDNPGHKFADKYFNLSTTNKEAVLELAKKQNVDGIVCYASDPAAQTAAYVAEKMGLPTNPYISVEILSNKDKFREFLSENGFNTPKAKGYTFIEDANNDISNFKLPVMIKPVDSSGSKGVSKLNDIANLESQINYALSFSRVRRFIIEEFVEKCGYQVAGDGFSVNGKLVFRCFANEHFDLNSNNPFVPIGESWPYNKSQQVQEKIHNEIQKLFNLLNMNTGAYNFDIRIDEHENVYLMEIGPRNGGNMIPQVIKYATGVDLVKYTIKAALGYDCSDLTMNELKGYWSCYMVHSNQSGILKEVWIDKRFKAKNIVEFQMHNKIGDKITGFTGSNGTIGTMIIRYDSQEEMLESMNNMGKLVKVITY